MFRLTAERLRRRWSQADLARTAGIPASDISKIEKQILKPYPGQLTKLSAALGVEPAHLLDDVDLVVREVQP